MVESNPYENAVAEKVNDIFKGEFLVSDSRVRKEEAEQMLRIFNTSTINTNIVD